MKWHKNTFYMRKPEKTTFSLVFNSYCQISKMLCLEFVVQ